MTKSQRLRADIQAGKTKYLHVSVLVGTVKQDVGNGIILTLPSRTPKGKGATARKNPDVEKLINGARAR